MKKLTKIFTLSLLGCLSFSSLFINKNNTINAELATSYTTIDNTLDDVYIVDGYAVGSKYLVFKLKNSDFAHSNVINETNLDLSALNYREISNFGSAVTIGGTSIDSVGKSTYFQYKCVANTIGVDITNIYNLFVDGAELVIPANTTFPTYDSLFASSTEIYKITEGKSFVFNNGVLRKNINVTYETRDVASIDLIEGYNNGGIFLRIFPENTDYGSIRTLPGFNNGNDFNLTTSASVVNKLTDLPNNCLENIIYKGEKLNFATGIYYINYRPIGETYGNIGFHFKNNESKFSSTSDTIVIPSGTTFPSIGYILGNSDIVYKTNRDITFVYYEGAFHDCSKHFGDSYLTDGDKHWHQCDVCSLKYDEASHNLVFGNKPATCTEEGYENAQYCSICNYAVSAGTVIPALGHDFTGAPYLYDEDGHWQVCIHDNCEETSEKHNHTFISDYAYCDLCDFTRNVVKITVEGGHIVELSDDDCYEKESEITVVADPASDKVFVSWVVDGNEVSKNSTYTLTVDKSISLKATFADKVMPADIVIIDDLEEYTTYKLVEPSGCASSIISSSIIVSILSILGISISASRKKKED